MCFPKSCRQLLAVRREVSKDNLKINAGPTLAIVGEHDPEKPTVGDLKRVMEKSARRSHFRRRPLEAGASGIHASRS